MVLHHQVEVRKEHLMTLKMSRKNIQEKIPMHPTLQHTIQDRFCNWTEHPEHSLCVDQHIEIFSILKQKYCSSNTSLSSNTTSTSSKKIRWKLKILFVLPPCLSPPVVSFFRYCWQPDTSPNWIYWQQKYPQKMPWYPQKKFYLVWRHKIVKLSIFFKIFYPMRSEWVVGSDPIGRVTIIGFILHASWVEPMLCCFHLC